MILKTNKGKYICRILLTGLALLTISCSKEKTTNTSADSLTSNEQENVVTEEYVTAFSNYEKIEPTQTVDTNSFEAHKTKHENYKFSYSASSYLVEKLSSGTTRYSPDNLGTVTGTPWVPENKNGKNGKGESITLKGEYDAHLMLAIRNGYQSTKWDDIYKKNARVKTFDIFCEESGMSMTVNLYDSQDTQVVDIRDILPKSGFSSITINLIVTDVYNGSKYSDLCVDSIIPYFGEGPSPSKVQIISDSNAEKNYAAEKKENANDWMWKCKLYVPAGIDWDDYFTLEELYSGLSENTVMETKVNGDRISITTTSVIDGITIATLNAVYECDKTNKYFTILGFTANTIGGNVSKAVYDIEDYGYCVGSIPSALESFFGKK